LRNRRLTLPYNTSIQKNDVMLTFIRSFPGVIGVSESISVPIVKMNYGTNNLLKENYIQRNYSYDENAKETLHKWCLEKPVTIEADAHYLFGTMRDLTAEEKEFESKIIAEKTTLTGVSFFD